MTDSGIRFIAGEDMKAGTPVEIDPRTGMLRALRFGESVHEQTIPNNVWTEIRGTGVEVWHNAGAPMTVRARAAQNREASPSAKTVRKHVHVCGHPCINLPDHNDYGEPCTHREAYEKITTHTRIHSMDGHPDVCSECSEALCEWIEWPCSRWNPKRLPETRCIMATNVSDHAAHEIEGTKGPEWWCVGS